MSNFIVTVIAMLYFITRFPNPPILTSIAWSVLIFGSFGIDICRLLKEGENDS